MGLIEKIIRNAFVSLIPGSIGDEVAQDKIFSNMREEVINGNRTSSERTDLDEKKYRLLSNKFGLIDAAIYLGTTCGIYEVFHTNHNSIAWSMLSVYFALRFGIYSTCRNVSDTVREDIMQTLKSKRERQHS